MCCFQHTLSGCRRLGPTGGGNDELDRHTHHPSGKVGLRRLLPRRDADFGWLWLISPASNERSLVLGPTAHDPGVHGHPVGDNRREDKRESRWPVAAAAGPGRCAERNLLVLDRNRGRGDLRPYHVVQFGSLLAVFAVVALLGAQHTQTWCLVVALVLYVVAKLLESFDPEIYALGGVVSGHTLKHLAAAGATYFVLLMLQHSTPF